MLNAYGIPAFVAANATASIMGNHIVAFGGLEIRVPEAAKADALELLSQIDDEPELPESKAFRKAMVLNICAIIFAFIFGNAYFPVWLRNWKI